MAGKNKKCVRFSHSEDEYETKDSGTNLDLPLEKLNLGPRKKLLVMNLNGFLLHRVHRSVKNEIPKSRLADGRYRGYLVFKRPFSEEFMKFCLERFEVGIWSSAMERNIDIALNYAIGPLRSKVLFVWDQRQCTNSGFKSLEKASKPLLFKEFYKVWEKPKKGGPFSASNTLLIDDKLYKAFLNSANSAIFPQSYKPDDVADRALAPKGELCLYLKGVAEARDVQSYVKDHPFGQPAITSANPDWKFYSRVKECLRKKRGY
ncbi:putative FCP1 likey domain-containing protein [Spatholobus suberectus]|nr:putative FCP1 likey domain-containing protein [Spatholobus suberectus]